jgi:hypothetical protein
MVIALTTSCVVPIPASPLEDGDAGANGIPDIVSASPANYGFPGPIELDRSSPQQITITLKDMDVEDTLVLRVFRNYPQSLPPLVETTGTSIGNGERLATLDTTNWCVGQSDDEQILFTLVVADRPFAATTEQPPFQAVTPGGLKSEMYWIATCVTRPQ